MKTLLDMAHSPMSWIMLVISASYVVMGHYIPVKPLGESFRVLQLSLAIAVVFAYWNNAMQALTCRSWPQGEDLIALGIVISWGTIALNGSWALLYRLGGQPAWLINNDFYNSWVVLNCVAASIHIIAPNLVGSGVPRADRLRLGSAWAVAAVVVAGLAWQNPDLSGFVEHIRPLVSEPADNSNAYPSD